jgi:hypothetical protein
MQGDGVAGKLQPRALPGGFPGVRKMAGLKKLPVSCIQQKSRNRRGEELAFPRR